MKILIIDDSKELSDAVRKNLINCGFEAECAYNGQAGLRLALTNEYDIILLDIMMPEMNGFKVLEKLNKEGRKTPVIMISAKNELTDRIDALDNGADDYIQKPFNINELVARIKAVLRRSNLPIDDPDMFCYADITVDAPKKKIEKNGLGITLSDDEFAVLRYLIKNSSVIVSDKRLCDERMDHDMIGNVIETIRRKLVFICSGIKIIFIKEVGYKLCC